MSRKSIVDMQMALIDLLGLEKRSIKSLTLTMAVDEPIMVTTEEYVIDSDRKPVLSEDGEGFKEFKATYELVECKRDE